MVKNGLMQITLWIASITVLTAFSRPLADGSRDLVRSLHGVPAAGCAKCEDDAANRHAFLGNGAFFDCQACNSCHGNWQSGWCGDYHCACGGETEDALTAGDRLAAETVAAVAATGDSREVAAFLARHPNRVLYNARRGVLQLLSCDAKVSAQFPVSAGVTIASD
jgi:hypothetical protein